MTYAGAPYVYYGDEAGMWGGNDPCCRKPMVWNDMEYRDEVYLPDQNIKNNFDSIEFNKEIFEHYKKMIAIRNSNPALQLGDFKTLLADDNNEIYAFERSLNNQTIFVVLNNSKSSQTVGFPTTHTGRFKDLLNDDAIPIKNGKLTFAVEEKWGRVLLKEDDKTE
jgi:glycosidase